MARVLRMPAVADDPTDAMLTAWLVDESGVFGGAQSLATLETESSVVSVEVSEPGVLLKVLVAPGERVPAGRPLAVLGSPGEVVDDIEQLMTRLGVAVAPAHGPGEDLSQTAEHRVVRHTTWQPHDPETPAPSAAAFPAPTHALIEAPAPEPAPGPAPGSATERATEPIPESIPGPASAPATTVPQVRLRAAVHAEPLLEVTAAVSEVSLTALVVKALVTALRQVGALPWSGTSTDVAVQRWTGTETTTTVIHVAGLMTPTGLTAALRRLESRGAEGRGPGGVDPVEVTVVDLGSYGAQEATLDATPTRPAVLTIGAVTEQAVVRDGALGPGKVLTLTLSCDESRVGAGAAARWLALLADLLENPLLFLT